MSTTTADLLIDEIKSSAEDLFKFGAHEGACTNEKQLSLLPKVPACKKHLEMMEKRKIRFKNALDQFEILRDILKQGIS